VSSENSSTIHAKLLSVQAALKAPKGQKNSFGNYNYRSCEDILEALKPLLSTHGLALTLSDCIHEIGSRFYVRAEATLTLIDYTGIPPVCVAVTAYAREEETKKGMDGSQITGAASSYARKYALNGLFCIDDTRDSDATNQHDKEGQQKPAKPAPRTPVKEQRTAPPNEPTADRRAMQNSTPPSASVAQQERILALAKVLGMDVQRDICVPMKAMWPMPARLAEATIKRLEQKAAEQARAESEMDEAERKGMAADSTTSPAQGIEGEAPAASNPTFRAIMGKPEAAAAA